MTATAYDPLARIDYKDSTVVYSAFGRLGWPIRNAACGYAEWDHWDADGCDLQLVNVQSHGSSERWPNLRRSKLHEDHSERAIYCDF